MSLQQRTLYAPRRKSNEDWLSCTVSKSVRRDRNEQNLNMAAQATDCDLLIVGGGINGCGIARDAAGRGLKVVLVEQGDLAGATSSASSK